MTHRPSSLAIALRLEGRRCLVAGTGSAAADRAKTLLDCGAHVRLVASTPDPATDALVHAVELEHRQCRASDLDDCWLAVYTDSDPNEARRIAADAEARRVLFCAVDQPDHNSYSHLAIARAASLFVAVGSEGKTPSLSRRLREEIVRLMRESDLASFVEKLADARARLPKGARAQAMNDAVRDVRITGRIELPDATAPNDGPKPSKR